MYSMVFKVFFIVIFFMAVVAAALFVHCAYVPMAWGKLINKTDLRTDDFYWIEEVSGTVSLIGTNAWTNRSAPTDSKMHVVKINKNGRFIFFPHLIWDFQPLGRITDAGRSIMLKHPIISSPDEKDTTFGFRDPHVIFDFGDPLNKHNLKFTVGKIKILFDGCKKH